MKIKNLNINFENIKKSLAIGLTAIVIGGSVGYILANIDNSTRENNIPKNDSVGIDDTLYIDEGDITYYAPVGYTLEGDRAVKRTTKIDEIPAKKIIDEETGRVIYFAPVGYTLEGDRAIKRITTIEYAEPIKVEKIKTK